MRIVQYSERANGNNELEEEKEEEEKNGY